MIDLHCHLCYGVDDGPPGPADAVALAKALRDAGVTEVACTPHVRPDKGWMNVLSEQSRLHQALDNVLGDADVSLIHHQGAEHYFDAQVFEEPVENKLVTYADTRWLLIEFSYQGPPPDLFTPLYRLRQKGYRLLLAHLERFPYACDDEDVLERLVNAGYLIQVNLGSLAGAYTRAHRKAAERLVTRGYASIASGDCHGAKDVRPFVEKGLKALRKLVGDEGVQKLTVDNPRALLNDQPPERIWP